MSKENFKVEIELDSSENDKKSNQPIATQFVKVDSNNLELQLNNDHENIGVILTESALESEHQSNICMVSQKVHVISEHC